GDLVVRVLDAEVLHAWVLGDGLLEALDAGLGDREAGVVVDGDDSALAAGQLGHPLTREPAALEVVGLDVGHGDARVGEVAVDRHYLDAGRLGPLERDDHRFRIVVGDHDRVGLLGDDRVDDRRLLGDVPLRRSLHREVDVVLGRHRLRAARDGRVEGIAGQTRHVHDGFLGGRSSATAGGGTGSTVV